MEPIRKYTSVLPSASPLTLTLWLTSNVQLLYVAGIACTALTFCVLLIASSNLRGNRNELFQPTYFSVAPGTFLNRRIAVFPGKMLYGLGSGEEDQAANMDAVAFGVIPACDSEMFTHFCRCSPSTA
uniref:Uncharacterized protein n=1 Tax=Guillardia theta TaxID=55529 RepID=A0A7S4KRQ5_GUITH|mmetsp:Transcript_29792/g.95293  ORF Transcript_29792/g.95293 Transcript_29792/m.95293 type:complete len:127 (+) Transcript_29792:747-1127(+)